MSSIRLHPTKGAVRHFSKDEIEALCVSVADKMF